MKLKEIKEMLSKMSVEELEKDLIVVADLAPKQVEHGGVGAFADMSDAELAAFAAETEALLQQYDGDRRLH